ncbi:MAG: phosphoribosyltransferase family protein [Vicinamibacterales bacterium]
MTTKETERRREALAQLKEHAVLMLDGHFDYGNGYHGSVYLNPHRIFRQPSLIWRLAQDLIDVLPEAVLSGTEVVAGPVMGGALFAHTVAGLIDGRRSLTRPPTSFAPLSVDPATGALMLRPFYRDVVKGRRVLLVDDVRNTGQTFERARKVIEAAGGTVIATAQICDRLEALVTLDVPNIALAEYPAPENHPAADCPLCKAGRPITRF